VVAPTAHLKVQWAAAAHGVGLHLDPAWSPADGLSGDLHGVVTTYQQVASAAPALRGLADGALVVLDEIHHAADERAWGDSIRVAFGAAHRRLALSGTPFRSDTAPIPFIRYELDEARPDHTYGYGDALRDGRVVRPVYFPRIGGEMEWVAPTGEEMAASFDDALDTARAAPRLRTALSLDGQWLPTVLRGAHERLTAIRAVDPGAGGLVIAIDQDHARGIADMMRWRFVDAVVVTSDDPTASVRIARFGAGTAPWLVAVRMVSEGVDIPRLAVGVYATTTATELFFRQAVGRFVRWRRGSRRQQAFLYIPDDPRLRARAFQIADERRHSLRRNRDDDAFAQEGLDDPPQVRERDETPSLFSVISAVATDHEEPEAPWDADALGTDDDDSDPGFELELAAPPRLALDPPGDPAVSRVEHKRRLRDHNAKLAQELVHLTGWPHAKVNAELNRRAGITRVTQATAEQLERRLRHAESWVRRV
jgi:superfamily II DNA or RNA helicase